MRLYFVRHGETQSNKDRIHQFLETELSADGVKQAKILAKRFRAIPIDLIISSDSTRAKQTTQVIAKAIKKEIIYTKLLRELKIPTEIQGKESDDPGVVKIKESLEEHAHDPNWRYSDEENFFEFRERIKKAFQFITTHKEENILIVSHARAIKMMLALTIFGEEPTPDQFYQIYHRFYLKNTGITVFQTSEQERWQILTWNDHAHLGEVHKHEERRD